MDNEQTPPPTALYGVWDYQNQSWTGEWIYFDNDAWEAAQDCARSGLPLVVIATRDDVDDEWLNEVEV